ncbi:MAG TPA: dihydrofolate reductase [Prosthecobacter sp.]|nr:dihydrofolate reductase [Prosthecobacter sp.]
MSTTVTLLAAISADGFISRGRGVPWKLPIDKAHFRAYAAGKWCLLGRITYEEMIGWFRDHHPLVISRDPSYHPPIGQKVNSAEEAIALANAAGAPELVVLGGSSVFDATIPLAHRLEITHVHDILGGGIPFPRIAPEDWSPVSRKSYGIDEQHAYSFEIVTYQRVARLAEAA